jgi:hypothetical protein
MSESNEASVQSVVMRTIEEPGYTPVECEDPLTCPFCGSEPRLAQLAHVICSERIGRSRKYRQVKVCIAASTRTLTADTFWFKCQTCGCSSGGHHETAQAAAEAWNRRSA